jgi:hypothetical protein
MTNIAYQWLDPLNLRISTVKFDQEFRQAPNADGLPAGYIDNALHVTVQRLDVNSSDVENVNEISFLQTIPPDG